VWHARICPELLLHERQRCRDWRRHDVLAAQLRRRGAALRCGEGDNGNSRDTTAAPFPDRAAAVRGGAQQRACHKRHGCWPQRLPEQQSRRGALKCRRVHALD
jgi:hypothetical protein